MIFNNYRHYVGNSLGNITFGYTKRTGGTSPYPSEAFNMALYIDDDVEHIHHHQDILASHIGFSPENWVAPIQRHGSAIKEVHSGDRGTNVRGRTDMLAGVDALYTYDTDTLLTMNYADCVPVYAFSEADGFIGLAHAGWRGTASEITRKLIESYHGDPADLNIIIGVAINGSCYEVDQQIIDALEGTGLPDDAIIRTAQGFKLDLKKVNGHQAWLAGVQNEKIHLTPLGTEDTTTFFSYRMEQGNTGRALAFIGRKNNDQEEL